MAVPLAGTDWILPGTFSALSVSVTLSLSVPPLLGEKSMARLHNCARLRLVEAVQGLVPPLGSGKSAG